jgi:phage-related protein
VQLVVLAKGTRWTVCAICAGRDECPTLDFIEQLEEARGDKALSDLEMFVPNSGVDEWARRELSKPLADGIYEFRWPRKKGGTPRVLWFYDDDKRIVCTHGYLKKDGGTHPAELERAKAYRGQYAAARARGALTMVSREFFEDQDEAGG